MIVKRFVLGITLLTLVVSSVVVSPVAAAQSDAPQEAERCRQLDAGGSLDDPNVALTRGECVNIFKDQGSEQANNRTAGNCGATRVLEVTGTTNKGQCIKVRRSEP